MEQRFFIISTCLFPKEAGKRFLCAEKVCENVTIFEHGHALAYYAVSKDHDTERIDWVYAIFCSQRCLLKVLPVAHLPHV